MLSIGGVAGMWCLTGLENGKQVVKKTGVVGHKSLSTKKLVVESLSDIETSKFKALLAYHFLIYCRPTLSNVC